MCTFVLVYLIYKYAYIYAYETEAARSLESKLDGIVAETQGAFSTLGGQLRDLSEVAVFL